MPIDVEEAFIGTLFIQLRQNEFFYTEDNTIFASYPDCCTERQDKGKFLLHRIEL